MVKKFNFHFIQGYDIQLAGTKRRGPEGNADIERTKTLCTPAEESACT